ncbi:MAG TPA: universal stress protein [Gammaproteobacteria bacterium]
MTTQAMTPAWKPARILLPTDGSEYSAGAVRVTAEMARRCGAAVTLTTALPLDNDLESLGTQDLQAQETALAQTWLDAAAGEMKAAGIPYKTEVRHAEHPDVAIVESAREAAADVIVMGRRGKRGLARLMVGHATAKVIGSAPCDVLVVPRAAGFWSRRILLATDGSAHSATALQRAVELGVQCQLPVSVLSVVTPGHGEQRRDAAQHAVDEAVTALKERGVVADGMVVEGRPDAVIVAQAQERADLIVLGSHGRTGLLGVLLGSVSERVIGAADSAVLIAVSPAE